MILVNKEENLIDTHIALNQTVNKLYNNLDAKDKIINEQALETAHLKERIDILIADNDQLENIRVKALEYIEEELYPVGGKIHGSDLPYDTIESLVKILGGNND